VTFSRRWLLLFALGAVPLMLSGLWAGFVTVALGWYLVLAGLATADWLSFPDLSGLQVERETPEQLSLGAANQARLSVRNGCPAPLRLELRDTPPPEFGDDLAGRTYRFFLAPGERQEATYDLNPPARGDYRYGDICLRVQGRLGMLQRLHRTPAQTLIKVYPSLDEAARFSLMARKGRLQQVGIRQARLQGAGSEFESLRDYMPDDELRRIDWKATARRGKLVARQYEVERSQTILLALDVGRTMRAEIDGVSKLDYAIRAALLLAYVASLTEDRVGLLVFSDTVHTYLPPKRGRAQVYAILDAVYNAQAALTESDYRSAFAFLQSRWRRRSLLVCFTDLWDPDSSRQTISELISQQPRHLTVAVTLLDPRVQRIAEQAADTSPQLYAKAVAMQMLDDRQRANSALTQRGVLVVDSPADKLSAELVNRYLAVKERMML
jgi:uncharacterized protein (DUF58 family)